MNLNNCNSCICFCNEYILINLIASLNLTTSHNNRLPVIQKQHKAVNINNLFLFLFKKKNRKQEEMTNHNLYI